MFAHGGKLAFACLLAAACLWAGGGRADESPAKPAADPKDESWVYRSKEHPFSLRLPSKAWKEIGKGKGVAAFHNPFPFPMTAGVLSVKAESLDQYRVTVQQFRDLVKKAEADLLAKPEAVEKGDADGNVRSYFLLKEKGTRGEQYLLVGMSYTWLKRRGVTVQVLFEGVGQARSRLFQAKEKEAFEQARKAICLGVE